MPLNFVFLLQLFIKAVKTQMCVSQNSTWYICYHLKLWIEMSSSHFYAVPLEISYTNLEASISMLFNMRMQDSLESSTRVILKTAELHMETSFLLGPVRHIGHSVCVVCHSNTDPNIPSVICSKKFCWSLSWTHANRCTHFHTDDTLANTCTNNYPHFHTHTVQLAVHVNYIQHMSSA